MNHPVAVAAALAALLVMMPLAGSSHAQAPKITITLDKTTAKVGEEITATGKAPSDKPFIIKIVSYKNETYRVEPIKPAADGTYTYKFKVGGPVAVNGEFTVTVAYKKDSATAKFTLTGVKEKTTTKPTSKESAAYSVTAKTTKKDTKVSVKTDKKKSKNVSKVVIEVDMAKVGKVKPPKNWKADVKNKTVTFTTDKALKPGKRVTFTIPGLAKTVSWTALDGTTQLEKGSITLKKK
jgi:hypothetical protein